MIPFGEMMDYQNKSIGDIVKEGREIRRLNQKDLAFHTHIDPVYICSIEKNRLIPSIKIGARIASVLNLNIKEFLFLILRLKHPSLSHIFQ